MDILKLSNVDRHILLKMLVDAESNGREVRVAFKNGLLVKVGQDMWTPPLGRP